MARLINDGDDDDDASDGNGDGRERYDITPNDWQENVHVGRVMLMSTMVNTINDAFDNGDDNVDNHEVSDDVKLFFLYPQTERGLRGCLATKSRT